MLRRSHENYAVPRGANKVSAAQSRVNAPRPVRSPGVADSRSGAATEFRGKILKFRPGTTLPCRLCLQKLCIFVVKTVLNPAPSGGGTRSGGNGILRCW